MPEFFNLGEDELTPGIALAIARKLSNASISDTAKERITKSTDTVDRIVKSGKVVYGINTGFGSLCSTVISANDTQKLQDNILRSHSVGVGGPVPLEVAKLMLVLKLQALSKGYSGISLEVLERIQWHLDNELIPLVPTQGSVGASGDLAPLAHLFLPLIGLGKVWNGNEYIDSGLALKHHNLEPIVLGPKEGLALINGTQFIAAYGVRALERLHNCLEAADVIGAMSLESYLGSEAPFDQQLHELRPYLGSQLVAHRLRTLLAKSEMVASHVDCERVQDPYSMRCMPQVHGASRNAWKHLNELVTTEINSVTDNPIIFSQEKTISGGNFHGQLLALPLDYATIAAAELGNISDRRTYLLLEGSVEGLPALLMKNTGINSGFMIPQYTSAALASENKTLCFPASVDSIPTSLGQEDHVSMGSISGRKLNQVIDNLENILAVELVSAAQAFDYRKPLKSGVILESCHELVRDHIDHAEEDRVFADDIQKANALIVSKSLVETANQAASENGITLNGSQTSFDFI